MSFFELVITAVALSMDAFAVAISKGLSVKNVKLRHGMTVGAYFGGFQALMPLIGFLLASSFSAYIQAYDHWIAFGMLALIGANMIRESFCEEVEEHNDSFAVLVMLPMAIATSVDALASGISFAVIGVDIWTAITIIGIMTFAFSAVGVKIGNIFGAKYQKKAEFAGGMILVILGIKILLEHLSGAA